MRILVLGGTWFLGRELLLTGALQREHPRWAEHGIAPEKEAAILAALDLCAD